MKWFEPLIAIGAIVLVALPIILKIRDIKKGKHNCSCGSDCASCSKDCGKSFRNYINSKEFKNCCEEINKETQ